jgi:hypothetical protein
VVVRADCTQLRGEKPRVLCRADVGYRQASALQVLQDLLQPLLALSAGLID